MAAHSSPRGVDPGVAEHLVGDPDARCCRWPGPTARARRPAGGPGRPSAPGPGPRGGQAAMAAAAAAVVVLPTPPGPQAMTISLAASRPSRDPGAARSARCRATAAREPARRASGRPRVGGPAAIRTPAPRRASAATWPGGPQPVEPREQVGQVQHRDRRVEPRPQPLEVAGPGPAHGHRQAGPLEDRCRRRRRPARRARPSAPAGAAARRPLPRRRPNSSGSTRFTTTADRRDRGLGGHPVGQLERLGHRHLLGRGHRHQPGAAGSERMSSIQSVWVRIRPTFTRSLMAWGAASWPTM